MSNVKAVRELFTSHNVPFQRTQYASREFQGESRSKIKGSVVVYEKVATGSHTPLGDRLVVIDFTLYDKHGNQERFLLGEDELESFESATTEFFRILEERTALPESVARVNTTIRTADNASLCVTTHPDDACRIWLQKDGVVVVIGSTAFVQFVAEFKKQIVDIGLTRFFGEE